MNTDAAPPARRSLNAEDVLRALRTLDQAAGADSNYFRWRVRRFLQHEEQLAERHRPAVCSHCENARKSGIVFCAEHDPATPRD